MNMDQVALWKQEDRWTWKEFIGLILLEFVFVMLAVKYGVQGLYEKWLDNTLYSGTLTGLTIAVVLMLGVYFIALRPKKLSWSEVGLRSFSARDFLRILLWTVLLIVGSVAVMELISYIGISYENSKTESLTKHINLFTVLIGIISAGVISPIYEEIFYRGFLYRFLRTRTGMGWAIVLSSLIFTVAHFPTTNAMPVNFVSGVIFAWAYERSGSVWPGVIVHGLVNTLAVLLTIL